MQLCLHCWVQVLSNDNIYSSTSKSFYQWLERNIEKTECIAVGVSDTAQWHFLIYISVTSEMKYCDFES